VGSRAVLDTVVKRKIPSLPSLTATGIAHVSSTDLNVYPFKNITFVGANSNW